VEDFPWADITRIVLLIYFFLTVLSMLARPDFLSIAVITAALFAIENPQFIQRKHFRILVVFALVTFVYDLVFLFFIRNVQAEDAEFDGQHINVNRFAYTFVWISFLFRPIVILVLWRDSLEFRKIIR